MRSLIALDIHGRDRFVRSLQKIWDQGDAVLPVDMNVPRRHLDKVLGALRPAGLIDADGRHVVLSDAVPVDEDTAVVITTSGTTGEPKGVVHTHRSVVAASRLTTHGTRTTSTSTWVACLPLLHIGGFSVITRALHADARLVVHDGFDKEALDSAARSGATHVSLVPTVLGRVNTQEWELILLGGSAIPDDRPANTIATYGMTETFGGVVYDGVPLPGVEVRLAADDHIEVRSPTLLRGYRSFGPVELSPPLTVDGFLRTGDIGVFDSTTGELRVEGRADDLVITGGVKVWPEPVERILEQHPLISECAVVGVTDREWGQRVTAVVVPRDPNNVPMLDELRGLVKEQLPAAHAPRSMVVTDHLTRTVSGKIRRIDIRFRHEHTYHH